MGWQQQINNHIVQPSSIQGLRNGQFPTSALHPIFDHAGKQIGQLCPEAALAWNAMALAAWKDGIALGDVSSYRPLSEQQSLFAARYVTTDQGNGSSVCGGKRWYLRRGQATAACPGSSNHGLGLAVDVSNATGRVLNWLEGNAKTFGFQWEIPSEAWHLHYMTGDVIPAAVLAAAQPQENDMAYIINQGRVYLLHGGKMIGIGDAHEVVSGIPQIVLVDADFAKAKATWPLTP